MRTFTGHAHFICNQPGSEKVADATFDWLEAGREVAQR